MIVGQQARPRASHRQQCGPLEVERAQLGRESKPKRLSQVHEVAQVERKRRLALRLSERFYRFISHKLKNRATSPRL